jgi:hypothetical protein
MILKHLDALNKKNIILASASPRRLEILRNVGLNVKVGACAAAHLVNVLQRCPRCRPAMLSAPEYAGHWEVSTFFVHSSCIGDAHAVRLSHERSRSRSQKNTELAVQA